MPRKVEIKEAPKQGESANGKPFKSNDGAEFVWFIPEEGQDETTSFGQQIP